MTRSLYALLVGIDQYPIEEDRLQGCVNDIQAVETFLEKHLSGDPEQLHVQTLFNEDATREGIINGFQQHLSKAQEEDVVLFYYSGHGSQETNIPEVLWRFEPDHKNETLYCYDSGLPNGRHLADKELSMLIAKVANNNPHICVILDCCHSGSGTKDIGRRIVERRVSPDERPRPIESYLFDIEELRARYTTAGEKEATATGWDFPQGEHVLIAACEDYDTAKELYLDGRQRGLFSYSLLETLKQPGRLTYRELLQEIKARVAVEIAKLQMRTSEKITQFPQLEVTPPSRGDSLFLEGAIAQRAAYFTAYYNTKLNSWAIDGGAIHGVQPPVGEETTSLALFESGCNLQDLNNPNKSVGEVKVAQVSAQLSQIALPPDIRLSTEQIYKAIITGLPLPACGVYIDGDSQGVALVQSAIESSTVDECSSLYICQVKSREEAKLHLQCVDQAYKIHLVEDNRPLVTPLPGLTLKNAERAVTRLAHIARWFSVRELSSPAVSQIQADDIKLEILFEDENDAPLKTDEIRRSYRYKDGKKQPPRCQIKLTNTSQRTLYCTLLNLTDRFAVYAPFFEAGYVRLAPGEVAWAKNGKSFRFEVDSELEAMGITETRDILKLIVSTAEFDARLSTQAALDVRRTSTRSVFKRSTLNCLMNRTQFRTIRAEEEERYDDWYTKQITITSDSGN